MSGAGGKTAKIAPSSVLHAAPGAVSPRGRGLRASSLMTLVFSLALHGAALAALFGWGEGPEISVTPGPTIEVLLVTPAPPSPARRPDAESAPQRAAEKRAEPPSSRSSRPTLPPEQADPPRPAGLPGPLASFVSEVPPPQPAPAPRPSEPVAATPPAGEAAAVPEPKAPPPIKPEPPGKPASGGVPVEPGPVQEASLPAVAGRSLEAPEAGSGADPLSGEAAASPASGNSPPSYPYSARKRGQEGLVVLEVLIDPDGSVRELQVANSSGHPLLDRAALSAVEDWRFEPARRGGQAVASSIRLPIRFQLTD